MLELLIVLALLGTAALFVLGPLRGGREDRAEERRAGAAADLELARESKYREIRELELDWRSGKLSDEDYRVQDRALRGEAIEILHALDRLHGREAGSG